MANFFDTFLSDLKLIEIEIWKKCKLSLSAPKKTFIAGKAWKEDR